MRTPWRLAVVAGALGVVAYLARDLWFVDDDWDYLTNRQAGDLDSYLEPHAGHWTLWTVPLFRALYALFALDYSPAYYLPRLVAAGLLALLLWRTWERRGAAGPVALAAVVVFAVLDAAAGHRAVSIGNYIVMAALIGVGGLLERDDRPTGRERVTMGVLLLVAVSAFGSGPILLGATGLVVALTRRWAWLPSVLVPGVVYLAWSRAYGPERARGLGAGELVEVPGAMVEVLGNAVASLVGIPLGLGEVVAVAGALAAGWWSWKRHLDRFDAVALLTVVAFLGATAVERVVPDFSGADTDRYGFVPLVALSLVVVPRLRVPAARWGQVAAALAAVALVTINLAGTHERLDELSTTADDRRGRVEAAAALLAAGEPSVADSWVVVPLTVGGLRRLVDDGWAPAGRPEEESRARGSLRVGLGPDAEVDGPGAECSPLEPGQGRTIPPRPALLASADEDARLQVTWTDSFGTGVRIITWADGRGGFKGEHGRFPLAEVEGGVEIELRALGNQAITVCRAES